MGGWVSGWVQAVGCLRATGEGQLPGGVVEAGAPAGKEGGDSFHVNCTCYPSCVAT